MELVNTTPVQTRDDSRWLAVVKGNLAGAAAGALAGGCVMALSSIATSYFKFENGDPDFLNMALAYVVPYSAYASLEPIKSAFLAGAFLGLVAAPIRATVDTVLPVVVHTLQEQTTKLYDWANVPQQRRVGSHHQIPLHHAVCNAIINRVWPNFPQDIVTAAVATTVVVMTKCMLFPVLSDLWETPRSTPIHVLACGFMSTFGLVTLAPVITVASAASRAAHHYVSGASSSRAVPTS